ncbi:MAG TPA: hypothetical protein VE843_02560 [Ktedonobacteraceae bacterium]|nr:hypothetical protein [Ktedonobacteraceae bacterium]
MKYSTKLANSICIATCVMSCLAVLFYSTTHVVTTAHAEQVSITGSVSSSPTAGPVSALISVSGSGWSEPDGEQVSLGYMIASNCLTVSDAQASTFKNGSFSGSLHLPNGTPLGTYSICANFGSMTAIANTYTVLTESSPQISISLSTQSGKQQASVSGSNYFPAGTTVNLNWETTNGTVKFTITPTVSNSSGLISRTFLIPTSIQSGVYKIVATVSGQPTLNTSASFTYHASTPTSTPTPSPTALPTSDPTPTKLLSPTTVATKVVSTPTTSATSFVGSQNTNTGQTPSSGTTSNGSTMNQLTGMVLIGSTTGVLALLAIMLITVLLIRRKKARSQAIAAAVAPAQNSPMSWQNNQSSGMPYPKQNGSMAVSPPWPATSSPPQQMQISPSAHLLQQPEGGSPVLTSGSSKLTPDNPNLESIKQQVQMGLFATSANDRDG